jgi:PIN domain nuclease of toxin-antitoxin system
MFNPVAFDENTVKVFHDVRYHTDPFDRAIVATALQMELPLISNDGKMHENNPCQLYWH